MKVKCLDGKTRVWSLGQYVGKQGINISDLHGKTREFLENNFPALYILEEVNIPGTLLRLDFYLPVLKISIECQGNQHSEYNTFFFKNKLEFFRAKGRDNDKLIFCQLNNIKLIYFYPEEDEVQWKKKLNLED